ncbi:hypothetical protein FD755_020114 [Muntiacus reevesi]|uniref:Uncharacterized protein n=1 Tax=Muntiacus reevesi TaxID=9886 RepID=A0A5N3X2I4_MUNRE|nr:hypothetical protein FD755_020114 [Muntiacus reevesi]
MYYLNQDAKLSNLFLQASSPTTGTAPRSQSRLSVCPSTQDICRSAISHDMSGASLEHCTPVTALSPARQEPGKKPVTQKPRRRRRAAQRDEHAREQGRGRRSDLHLHVPSPRCSETDTDSSDSSSTRESHWIQAKRRAPVKFRLSRRRRRKNKPSGILGEPSAPRGISPVHLGSEDKKHPKLTSCESRSLNLLGAKGTTYEGCGVSLSRSSESKRPSRKQQESRGGDPRGDPQLLHRCGQNERTIKRRFSGTDSSTEMLAVKGGKSAGDAGFQEPPATDRDGSDHLHACSFLCSFRAGQEGELISRYLGRWEGVKADVTDRNRRRKFKSSWHHTHTCGMGKILPFLYRKFTFKNYVSLRLKLFNSLLVAVCGEFKIFFFFFFPFIFISWRLITLQYCSGFCHTLT